MGQFGLVVTFGATVVPHEVSERAASPFGVQGFEYIGGADGPLSADDPTALEAVAARLTECFRKFGRDDVFIGVVGNDDAAIESLRAVVKNLESRLREAGAVHRLLGVTYWMGPEAWEHCVHFDTFDLDFPLP